MLEQLRANKNKVVILELTNGRIIKGRLLNTDEDFVHIETSDGIGILLISNIQIIWEQVQPSQTAAQDIQETYTEKTETIEAANPPLPSKPQGSDPQAEITCTGFPGFTCNQQYICRPPDICTFAFSCLGRYFPGTYPGGGPCPSFFCNNF